MRRSPVRGRFFDEHTDCENNHNTTTNITTKSSTVDPVDQNAKQGVSEENYRLLVEQLVLCNDEIERLYGVEKALLEENASLKQALAATQSTNVNPIPLTSSPSPSPTPSKEQNLSAAITTPSKGPSVDTAESTALRPYLGVEVIDTGSEVVVKNILPGGGADDAGLQVNDILLKWNGRPITSRSEFGLLVSQAQIGSMVKLQLERGPKHQTSVLRVEVKGTTGPKAAKSPKPRAQRSGSASQSSQDGHGISAALGDLERLNQTLN